MDALLDLRGRGVDVAVVEVSPEPFTAPLDTPDGRLAHRIWRLQGEALHHRNLRAGVAVAAWREQEPLALTLEEVGAVPALGANPGAADHGGTAGHHRRGGGRPAAAARFRVRALAGRGGRRRGGRHGVWGSRRDAPRSCPRPWRWWAAPNLAAVAAAGAGTAVEAPLAGAGLLAASELAA